MLNCADALRESSDTVTALAHVYPISAQSACVLESFGPIHRCTSVRPPRNCIVLLSCNVLGCAVSWCVQARDRFRPGAGADSCAGGDDARSCHAERGRKRHGGPRTDAAKQDTAPSGERTTL